MRLSPAASARSELLSCRRRVSVGAAADPNIELVSAAHDGDLIRVKEALEAAKADINFQVRIGQLANIYINAMGGLLPPL